VTHRKFAIFTNVGVQIDNIHIRDFFPLFDFVVCFGGFGSTPHKASSIFIGEFFT
jgi:hypothetical protein